MDVTRDNFVQVLPEIIENLDRTTLMAIDLEMSGIKMDYNTSESDLPMEYFHKAVVPASRYRIIQLGMTLFMPLNTSSSSEPKYATRIYNFYLFPHACGRNMNQEIRMGAGAIEFLNKEDTIDFNKWIKKGLNYFNEKTKKKLKDEIFNDKFSANLEEIICGKSQQVDIYSPDKIKELDKAVERFVHWFEKDLKCETFCFTESSYLFTTYFLQEINKKCKDVFKVLSVEEIRRSENVNRHVKFTRLGEAGVREFIKNKFKQKDSEYREALEFSHAWKLIKEAIKKRDITVTLHNSFLDLLFIYSHLEKPLTKNMLDFKNYLHTEMFPSVFDTKLVSNRFGYGKLSLGQLYEELQKSDKIKNKVIFEMHAQKEGEKMAYHNAGYDSYVTGCAFLLMKNNADLSDDRNKVKLYGQSCFYLNLPNPKMDCLARQNVYVFFPKYKSVPVIKKGKEKPENKKKTLFDKITQLSIKNAQGIVRVTEHKFPDKIKMQPNLFVWLEKELLSSIREELKQDYDIFTMEKYYTFILELFDSKVYKTSDVNKVFDY